MELPPDPAFDRPHGELQTSVRSAHEHVCGAEMVAHWGMLEADGTMRTHLLAGQVLQRLSGGRANRSSMLSQLAGQLEQFHDLQLAREDEVEAARARVASLDVDVRVQQSNAARLRQETRALVEEGEVRLAASCCEFSGRQEVLHAQGSCTGSDLEQSRARLVELRAMVHRMAEKNGSLQDSIDKTAQKFEEFKCTYATLQAEMARARVLRPRPEPELEETRRLADHLGLEVDRSEGEVSGLRAHLADVREAIAQERTQTLRLEDFVRRLAVAPSARMRTGGGYAVDNTAKHEAAELIQEIAMG